MGGGKGKQKNAYMHYMETTKSSCFSRQWKLSVVVIGLDDSKIYFDIRYCYNNSNIDLKISNKKFRSFTYASLHVTDPIFLKGLLLTHRWTSMTQFCNIFHVFHAILHRKQLPTLVCLSKSSNRCYHNSFKLRYY